MTEAPGHAPKERRVDRAALVIAAALVGLGGIVWWDATRLGGVVTYARIGPQTAPFAIALCLAALGLWTAIEAWRGDFPARERQETRPVLWVVAGLLAQLLLLRTVGFSIATGVMFGLVATGLGRRPLWLTVPIGIVLSLVVWLIFSRGLQLTLPAGPVESAILLLLGPR